MPKQIMLREKSLIYAVAKQTGMTYEEAEKVHRIIFASIERAVSRGYIVYIESFGTFRALYIRDRVWEDPLRPTADGETEHIVYAHMGVKFKAHKHFNDKVAVLMPHEQRFKEKPKYPE